MHRAVKWLSVCAVTGALSTSQLLALGYTEPNSYKRPSKTERPSKSKVDTSGELNNLITRTSNAGGGRIHIPRSTYSWGGIQLKKNVHLIIAKNTTINGRGGTMFNFGNGVFNASVRAASGNFKVNMKAGTSGRAFVVTGATNFLIRGVAINDRNTMFSSVEYTWGGVSGNNKGSDGRGPSVKIPRKGTLKNITTVNSDFGYGIIQITAGDNLRFENLRGNGGVTLRCETHWVRMQNSGTGGTGAMEAINLSQNGGQTVVKLQPHTMRNGKLTLRKVNAVGCATAIAHEKGFRAPGVKSGRTAGRFNAVDAYDINATARNSGPEWS